MCGITRAMAREIVIPQTETPKRLENFLKKRFPIGYVRKLFRRNSIRLNGKRSGPDEIVQPGDRITLFLPFEEKRRSNAKPTPAPRGFKILFEDDDILIINKHAGIAVHEGKEILKRHTLLGMLEAAYRPKGIVPRLVHRIDKETSGLLVVGKKPQVVEDLEKRFEGGEVEKEYLALVVGQLAAREGSIDFPLPGREGRRVSALTHYRVEREYSQATLVRVRMETGRMHQVRLHFAKLGHPIVMDAKHGNFAFNKQFRKTHGLKRQFLHASTIALEYRGKKRKWTAPLPDDLAAALRSLAQAAGSNSHL
ncbi:MAG: RluA family pseudouridine synthase [Deltaproteobacteria bacterium]|nr:RluA family pseudouridine synthase [Deltaproteobacteria bacterium]